ncbi:energy transducer TonB [Tsuneonella sp. HG222]
MPRKNRIDGRIGALQRCPMFARFLTLGVALALSLPAWAADEPGPSDLVLRPSSNWIMNYKDNSCGLQRVFGAEGQTVMLDLDRFAPGDSLQISVQSGDLARARGKPRIVYLPRGETGETRFFYLADYPEGRKGKIIASNPYRLDGDPQPVPGVVPPERSREEIDSRNAEINALRLGKVFERDIELSLGSMGAPMKALDECVDDLVRDLGVDTLPRDLSRQVAPNDQASWAQRIINDYPRDMIQQSQSAFLQVRLIVDENGRVANCYVRTQDDSFSKSACFNLVKYAQFFPALDKQGKAVKSIWTTRITYQLTN